ncbi:hypothetical protein ACWEK5_47975 [Rhodococcus koreensis]
MAEICRGRFTADISALGDEMVVYLIGARINSAQPITCGRTEGASLWPQFTVQGFPLRPQPCPSRILFEEDIGARHTANTTEPEVRTTCDSEGLLGVHETESPSRITDQATRFLRKVTMTDKGNHHDRSLLGAQACLSS